MAFTSKDFSNAIDKVIKQGLENNVPTQFMFANLALRSQEMGNYHIQREREKVMAEQAKHETGLIGINGVALKSVKSN
jgi:hypothetical protein